MEKFRIILDPGSRPAPRDLAGMTDWDMATEEKPSVEQQACPVLDTGVEVRITKER